MRQLLMISIGLLLMFCVIPYRAASAKTANEPIADTSFSTLWSADDKPYQEAIKKIKEEHDKGESPESIVQECRRESAKEPNNPVAQFTLVAALRAQFLTRHPGKTLPYDLVEQLKVHDPGNSYAYTRYLFCMTQEARHEIPVDTAERVGNKLIEYNTQDNWTRRALIYELCGSSIGGPALALPYAEEWTKLQPNNSKAYWALGYVYFDLFEAGRGKAEIMQIKVLLHFKSHSP